MNHFVVSAGAVCVCTLGAGIFFLLKHRTSAEWFLNAPDKIFAVPQRSGKTNSPPDIAGRLLVLPVSADAV